MTMAKAARVGFAAAILALLPEGSSVAQQAVRREEILTRAASYVREFVVGFSNVVAEEEFIQDVRAVRTPPRGKGASAGIQLSGDHRVLKSDFLLVQAPGGSNWRSFRDIFEVDGQPVRDRQERLTRLFLQGSQGGMDLARALVDEGARFNIGDPARSINNPLLALGYLQAIYQPRFRFSLGQPDPSLGQDVWIVEYKERTRPTMLRMKPDADLVSSGRMWIEAKTGRVRRTELTVLDSDEITTSFRFDDGLQMDVPYEMRETYWFGGYLVTGTATYGSFRRFQVSTEETIR